MGSDSYYPMIGTEDVYKDISGDIGKLFNKLNYDERRRKRLSVGKTKKAIRLRKDEKLSKIYSKFVAKACKSFSYILQKDDRKIKELECVREKRVKLEVLDME